MKLSILVLWTRHKFMESCEATWAGQALCVWKW